MKFYLFRMYFGYLVFNILVSFFIFNTPMKTKIIVKEII